MHNFPQMSSNNNLKYSFTITDSSTMFAEGDLEQFCNEYSSLDATMKKDIYESWELLHDTVQKYLKIYCSKFLCQQDFATIIDKIFLDDSGTSGEISISAITIEKNPYICSSKSKDKKDKISNKHFGDSRYSVFDWDFKAYSKVELLEELEEETIVLLRISALGSNLSLENYERTYLYNRFKKFKIDDPNPIVHSAAGILKRILSVNGPISS